MTALDGSVDPHASAGRGTAAAWAAPANAAGMAAQAHTAPPTDSVPAEVPVTAVGIPPAEVEIDEAVVRALLRDQFPDLGELPLRHVATGWDNSTFQLGDALAVRLPRIHDAVPLLRNEQRWLPWLARQVSIPVPVPVRCGEPSAEFPWPWSVVPWVVGRTAEHEAVHPSEAARFGDFLGAVHQPAPEGFPRNDYRGVPLASATERVEERLRRLSRLDTGLAVPLAVVRERWEWALTAPIDIPETCVHGDLHPKNLVLRDGRLAAVLDWGDMTVGDPAGDLGAAWMLFPTTAHSAIWRAYGRPISAHTMARAIGWAVFFGVMLLDVGLTDDPPFAEIGRRTLARVFAGESGGQASNGG